MGDSYHEALEFGGLRMTRGRSVDGGAAVSGAMGNRVHGPDCRVLGTAREATVSMNFRFFALGIGAVDRWPWRNGGGDVTS